MGRSTLSSSGELFTGPVSCSALEAHHKAGKMPLTIAHAMDFGRAAGLVLLLPPIATHRDGMPVGYGLMPPVGAESVVKTKQAVRDTFGEPVAAGAAGVLGAMWRETRRPERVALRLWFRAEQGHGYRPAQTLLSIHGQFRMVDCFDDVIGSVSGLGGIVAQLTGWQIVRLDADVAHIADGTCSQPIQPQS